MNGICYIVGAGELFGLPFRPGAEDLVVAADAGFAALEEAGIRADLAVGDFDTLRYTPDRPDVVKLPAEKDVTDMWAAVEEGVRAGYERFHIYGGTGGRIAHTIANLQLVAHLARDGKRAYLFGKDTVITAVTDGSIAFPADAGGYISVFAHGGAARGVTIRGLKYELTDATLSPDVPLGVSNEFTGAESEIRVESGTVLIAFPIGIPIAEDGRDEAL